MRRILASVCIAAMAGTATAQVAPQQTASIVPAQRPAQTPSPPDEEVDSVTVTAMVPVPDVGDGAAYYSPENLQAMENQARRDQAESQADARKCQVGVQPAFFGFDLTLEILLRDETAEAQNVANLADKAAKATEVAIQARKDAAAGTVAMAVVEKTELARQDAVNKYEKAKQKLTVAQNRIADAMDLLRSGKADQLDWGELDFRQAKRARYTTEDMKKEFADLELKDVKTVEYEDSKKGYFLRVTGTIHNKRTVPAPIPAISISAIDDSGFALSNVKVQASRGATIKAGVAAPFQYDVRPVPDGSHGVLVHFSSKATPPPRMSVNAFCGENAPYGPNAEDNEIMPEGEGEE